MQVNQNQLFLNNLKILLLLKIGSQQKIANFYKMKLKTAIVLFTALLLTHKLSSQDLNRDTIDHYITNDFECVILPVSRYTFNIGGYTPTREEIDNAEKVLKSDLKRLNRKRINQGINNSPVIHENLRNYVRQYFGYIDNKGNKHLFINFIWRPSAEKLNWLEEEVNMIDGGSYFWSIRYNINKKRLFDLSINGQG